MTGMAFNPILPGFHPDPSIVCVEGTFYLVTSTFEWYPGVALYRSVDLLAWEPLPAPLDRKTLIDLSGVPDSGGVWAPCLTHDGERFFLTYSNVRAHGGIFQDCHNYVTTADEVTGPWSDPVFLHSYGADPSLFHVHDEQGNMRRYVSGTRSESLAGRNPFGGIILHELDPDTLKVREPESENIIFSGTGLGCTEGPHLYKRGDWFYLITAEGGTGYDHAVTVARSKDVEGPYEAHPDNPLLTSAGSGHTPLHRAGHGDLVEASDGRWFLVHLCSRIPDGVAYEDRYSPLGRETAIQEVQWSDDDWPSLVGGGRYPRDSVQGTGIDTSIGSDAKYDNPAVPVGMHRFSEDVDRGLPPYFLSPRVACHEYSRISGDDQGLILTGGESPRSLHDHHLIARRVQHHRWQAETSVAVYPRTSRHMAGIMVWYNREAWHYLLVTAGDQGPSVRVLSRLQKREAWSQAELVLPPNYERVYLKVVSDSIKLSCSARVLSSDEWTSLGSDYELSTLSDERVPLGGFTGTFVGLACHDLTGCGREAAFEYLNYTP